MAQRLAGKVAWVTGAGSGIGEGVAVALADEGATVVLTGRRAEPLERLAQRIHQAGGTAHVQPGDLMDPATPQRIADWIVATLGRIDILANNAGLNIKDRHWDKLTPAGIDTLVHGNLSSALYCVAAVLPTMRKQQDGVIVHTASMAGRFIGGLSGPIYTAAKHGVVAMSHTINMEECHNGIRSTAMLPGEVATPILDQRPIPVTPEERARLVQPEDCGDLVRYIATLPKHVCINEVMITPAWNRGYIAARTRL
ncbi:MAG: SDR family oxidoreductase [Proteobacteria bacterium]|nr:SDR family oxidoreductase [Pseudomonadota bacterium]